MMREIALISARILQSDYVDNWCVISTVRTPSIFLTARFPNYTTHKQVNCFQFIFLQDFCKLFKRILIIQPGLKKQCIKHLINNYLFDNKSIFLPNIECVSVDISATNKIDNFTFVDYHETHQSLLLFFCWEKGLFSLINRTIHKYLRK